jgi:translation initiation factor 1A
MPTKNKKKGKNSKNKGGGEEKTKRILVFKHDSEEYAKIEKMLGDRRLMVILPDNSELMAVIPGRFKKKRGWMKTGDVVLISFRSFQEDKCDVIYRYEKTEVAKLIGLGELPFDFITAEEERDDDDITFVNEDDGGDFDFKDV